MGRPLGTSAERGWTAARIEAVKEEIRRELDRELASGGAAARLEAILGGVRRHEEMVDADGRLALFVYVVSALVHQERFGGLGWPQVNRLTNLAYAVLKFQGIHAETSKLGYLYGELHLGLSQIHRRDGDHWTAAWEQQLAFHVARRRKTGTAAWQDLAIGLRAIRLGQSARALELFASAEAEGPGPTFERARINRIRGLRLCGRGEEAGALARETLAGAASSERFRDEVAWEQLCLQAATTGDLSAMMASVGRHGAHHQAVYIVEAFFWAHAVRELQYVRRLPKMQTLARRKDLSAKTLGSYFKAALALETCYDQAVPLMLRLRSMGETLGVARGLLSIDRELLLQLAATRWLARVHATSLAATALGEFQGTSLKLTLGASCDALGVAGDLFTRSWSAGSAA